MPAVTYKIDARKENSNGIDVEQERSLANREKRQVWQCVFAAVAILIGVAEYAFGSKCTFRCGDGNGCTVCERYIIWPYRCSEVNSCC